MYLWIVGVAESIIATRAVAKAVRDVQGEPSIRSGWGRFHILRVEIKLLTLGT